MMNIFKLIKSKLSKDMDESYNPDIGNLTIKNSQVFVDGREIDIETTSNIRLTQKNGKILVNGQTPKYKER